jgi:ribosomal protein S18 acetylase RimI-like enzyme
MQPSDATFVERLAQHAFGEYSMRAGTSTLSMARGRGALSYIAYKEQRPAGFAVLELQAKGNVHLAAIAVQDADRGTGVGRTLLSHVEKEAASRCGVWLRLWTSQANLAALDLFLKTGFKIEQRLARYYSRGQDAVLMVKRLESC